MKRTSIFSILILFFAFSSNSYSQKDKEIKEAETAPPSVTRHVLTYKNGKSINYTATSGYMLLETEDGKDKARIFYTAYTKEGANLNERPITYTFNGGPGSASVWLHM